MTLENLKYVGRFAIAIKFRLIGAGAEARPYADHPRPDRPYPGPYALLVGIPRR
jgi:hypothetical protein